MNTIRLYFIQIVAPLLTIIGTIGNIITFYILTRKKFIQEPIYRYFIINSIISLIAIMFIWIQALPVLFEWRVDDTYCKIFMYLSTIGHDLFPWVIAINSIDRLLSFKYPQKFLFRKKFQYQALIISSIILILMLVNITQIIFQGIFN
jgi:hypothetical protein